MPALPEYLRQLPPHDVQRRLVDLLNVLCDRLQLWTDYNGAPQAVVSQVKEKWGELAFYGHGGNHKQDGMIEMAEAM